MPHKGVQDNGCRMGKVVAGMPRMEAGSWKAPLGRELSKKSKEPTKSHVTPMGTWQKWPPGVSRTFSPFISEEGPECSKRQC